MIFFHIFQVNMTKKNGEINLPHWLSKINCDNDNTKSSLDWKRNIVSLTEQQIFAVNKKCEYPKVKICCKYYEHLEKEIKKSVARKQQVDPNENSEHSFMVDMLIQDIMSLCKIIHKKRHFYVDFIHAYLEIAIYANSLGDTEKPDERIVELISKYNNERLFVNERFFKNERLFEIMRLPMILI